MLKSEVRIKEINTRLAWLAQYVKFNNQQGMTDINKAVENFFCGLLNIIFDASLENMNYIQRDYPAVDLGDEENRLAVQVTSTSSRDKIIYTLDKFFEHRLDQHYNRLIILIVGKKEDYRKKFPIKRNFTFDKDRDIWDVERLGKEIDKLENDTQEAILCYLDEQIKLPWEEYQKVTSKLVQARTTELGAKPKVFVSHSSKDQEIVKRIVSYLEDHGIKCWVSYRDLPVGSSFADEIPGAIDACPFFLLLLSANSIGSRDVSKELSLASQSNKKTQVLPLQLEALVLPSSFKYHLVNVQIRSYYEEPKRALEETVRSILGDDAELVLKTRTLQTSTTEETPKTWVREQRIHAQGDMFNAERNEQALNMAASYEETAKTYSALGNYRKALEYYERALAFRQEVLPMDHPEIAQSYSNLGQLYNKLGDHRRALEYLGKAQSIWESKM